MAFAVVLGTMGMVAVAPAASAADSGAQATALRSAFADPTSVGNTMTLTDDVTLDGSAAVELASGAKLTLDLDGHVLTITGVAGPNGAVDSQSGGGGMPGLTNLGSLVIENGTLNVTGGVGGAGIAGSTDGANGGNGGQGAPAVSNTGVVMLTDVTTTLTGGAGGAGGDGSTGADAAAGSSHDGDMGGMGGNGGSAGAGLHSSARLLVRVGGSLALNPGIPGHGGSGGAGGTGDGEAHAGAVGSDGATGHDAPNPPPSVTFDANDGAADTAAVYTSVGNLDSAVGVLGAVPGSSETWPTRTGFTFAGWHMAADGTGDVDPTASVAGQTLFASWAENTGGGSGTCDLVSVQADLTAAASGDSVALCGDITVAGGEALTVPAGVTLDLDGHTITNDGTLTNEGTVTTPAPALGVAPGTLTGTGTIANNGAITHTVTVVIPGSPGPDGLTVSGNDYFIGFTADGGSSSFATPRHVYAEMDPVVWTVPGG